MSESKTYVFPNEGTSGGGNSIDAGLLALMKNNGGFGDGNGSWLWVLFLFFLYPLMRNGGFLGNTDGSAANKELLMSAIQGNGNAINALSTNLNCSVGQVQQAVNALSTQIQSVGNQNNMTGMQVMNAIERGNATLAQQLSACCCEDRLAICQQTNTLQNNITQSTENLRNSNNAGFSAILGKLDAMQTQALQDKIEALREKNGVLTTQLNLEHQTAAIASSQAQAVAPLNAGLAALNAEVASIKCRIPETVNVPYQPFQAIPNCIAYQMGLYNAPAAPGFWY